MKIYDYHKFSHVYFGGSALNKEESLIPTISRKLSTPSNIEPHPKEIERMERLKKRKGKSMRGGMSMMRKGDGSYNNSVIILSGSTGFGSKSFEHFDEILKELNKLLEENNTHLVFVRGNNDDPSYFTEGKIDYSNIKAVDDYSLLKFNGFNCLCVGGGVSLDRKWKKTQGERLKKSLYWKDEPTQFRQEELKKIIAENDIACVITHVPPSFIGTETSSYSNSKWSEEDKQVIADAINERIVMDNIYTEFVKANKKPYVWTFTSDGNNNTVHINNIRFVPSDSINNIFSLNDTVESVFGFRLGGDEVSKYLKKAAKSFGERIQMYTRNLEEDMEAQEEEGHLDGDAEMEFIDDEPAPNNHYPDDPVDLLYDMEIPRAVQNVMLNNDGIRYEPLRADRRFIQRPAYFNPVINVNRTRMTDEDVDNMLNNIDMAEEAARRQVEANDVGEGHA